MVLREERTGEAFGEPCRLCVRHLAEGTELGRGDLLLLAFDCANLQPSVLRFEENFVSVESEERFGRVPDQLAVETKVSRATY